MRSPSNQHSLQILTLLMFILITPPCTEGVAWYVLKNPGHIAPEQAVRFVTLIGEDARGPQPKKARIVLEK